jgi:hypothetical protein
MMKDKVAVITELPAGSGVASLIPPAKGESLLGAQFR